LKLKPYRFKLPAIGITVAALLIYLQEKLDAARLLDTLNEVINLPASMVFHQLTWGLHVWYNSCIFLGLTELCWYVVGLELDLDLLKRSAAGFLSLRVIWLLIAAGLQYFPIYVVCAMFIWRLRFSGEGFPAFVDVLLGFIYLTGLAWVEGVAIRFWRASRPLTLTLK
jgi:hypothetical protein